MGRSSTTIYAASITPLKDAELFSRLYSSIPFWRKAKVDSTKIELEKCQALGASALLLHGLRDRGIDIGADVESVAVAVTPQGKPYFKYLGPVEFSISHSGKWVLCGISDRAIGCDVQEHYRDDERVLTAAKRYFSKAEYERVVNEETTEKRLSSLYDLWTMKESYVKMLGYGIDNAFSRIQIEQEDDRLCVVGLGRKGFLRKLPLAEGYSAACCLIEPEDPEFIAIEFH